MRVYRVETVDGHGPYNPRFEAPDTVHDFSRWLMSAHGGSPMHPSPWEEDMGDPPKHYFYGFETITQAQTWFSGWGTRLADHGFFLCEYRVADRFVLVGSRQVAFERAEATLVTRHSSAKMLL